ncbi:spore protease YyaC [Bacillus cereus]|nr:spore protease YyaC [Bacillus cereus]
MNYEYESTDRIRSSESFTTYLSNQLKSDNYSTKFKIDHQDPRAIEELAKDILFRIKSDLHKDIVLVCVGTDRSTGDSLGPLVGYHLKEYGLDNFTVYGELDDPVHAVNIPDKLDMISNNHPNSLVIAIDSSMTRKSANVGHITIEDKPLKPGAAMNKDLPEIGELSISGLVNIHGSEELNFFVLQNTRLSVVMRMSKVIAQTIKSCDELISVAKAPSSSLERL